MKQRLLLLSTLCTLLLLGGGCFFLLLPYLSDAYLLPRIIKELPFSEKELSISRVSLWKTRATITLANAEQQSFSIPRVELRYSPTSLLDGKIETLLIDSAVIHLELINGALALRGFSPSPGNNNNSDNTPELILPFEIETLVIKNCTLTLHKSPNKTINIIVNSRLFMDFENQQIGGKLLTSVSGEIFTRGDMTINGTFDGKNVLENQEIHLRLETPSIEELSRIFPQLLRYGITGKAVIKSNVLARQFSHIQNFDTTIELSQFRCSANGITAENKSPEKPISLLLRGDLEKMDYNIANLTFSAPTKSSLDIEGTFSSPDRSFTGNGQLVVDAVQSPVTLNYIGQLTATTTHIDFELQVGHLNLVDRFFLSPLTAKGRLNIKGTNLLGNLNLQIEELSDQMSQTSFIGNTFEMDLEYPFPTNTPPLAWSFSVDQIQHQGVNVGKIKATLTPAKTEVDISTLFTSPFGPDLKVNCDGSLKFSSEISFTCLLPQTRIDSDNLPPFVHLPEDLSFSGEIDTRAELSYINNHPKGSLALGLQNGTINYLENTLSGISLKVNLPYLPKVESSPSQVGTINSLEFGTIKMSKGLVHFRIEDSKSVFLEKVHLNWAGGKVETGSFRLASTMDKLETTLYCDRLIFTELLDQFGIENTEGQGSLNGKLPISVSSNSIHFDDGFLFSTPGNNGIVRFNNTEQLRQGLPSIEKAAYLDYSMKAMENFSYNWTKLSFNTEDKDLLIKMQLDGKPAEPLPFGYKNGQIVPSTAGPGLQHPVRLDVNFRLPLQNMFQYGKNIQSLMEKM